MSPPAKKPTTPGRVSRRNLVGKVIKKIRKTQGLTCEELAAKVHVRGWEASEKMIARIENGRREVNDVELRILAKSLRVSIAALFEST